ncbi:aminotransferase class V [Amycolatopsis orientalis]|uniref:Aminotransferase class V n=1 Tax=Amycolatopsis orientalis TaxID=31958 RepID=A0A193BVR4_AMYOR|nr:aminotransferase class V-fold PLP-dependent enzyme [Amycolatopsis orientalis]ANN16312.1 aminotransferase class V [Amycolatopsis orientalis]
MQSFGAEFAAPPGYLNTPSIGVPPAPVADAVAEAVERWRRGEARPSDFDEPVARTRAGFGALIGVPADRVAIGASVSQLIANVAAGLPDGASVLVAENDFTSVSFPFAAQAHRGVKVTEVPLAELTERVEGHDLVAVSVVQSADGAQVDLDGLRAAAEAADAAVLLDATQAAGWRPLDLGWADWVVAAGYKWLLAPRGAAWLAAHPRALERAVPVAANWYAGEDRWQAVYGLPLRLADGTRSLDLSPAWFSFVGAAVSLEYLGSLDLEAVRAHCVGLADSLLEACGSPAQGSAIVSLDLDAERVREAGIVAGTRAGRQRFGFHLYNTADDVERVISTFR